MRRAAARLREVVHEEFIQPRRSGFSRVARGAAFGGVAGGMIGLVIEMSPEEYDLRAKTRNWVEKGNQFIDSYRGKPSGVPQLKPLTPAKVALKQAEVVAPSRPSQPVTQSIPEDVPVNAESSPGKDTITDDKEPSVVAAEIAGEDELKETDKLEQGELTDDESVQEALPAEASSEITDELPAEVLPSAQVAALQLELAKSRGEMEATLETLERLYAEREKVIAIARHALVVNDLLHGMALDRNALSAGALRVEFDRKFASMVESCFFQSESRTFLTYVLSKLLAALYFPCEMNACVSPALSPTWRNLQSVQAAKSALAEGDFPGAALALQARAHNCMHANAWLGQAQQAMQLWQGADAAVASVHDDLAQIL